MTGPIDELRDLALAAPEPEAALAQYVATVSAGAYAVTDADVEALKQAGVSEERIFEATASVAIGEGLRRLDAAFAVIA